MWGIRFATPEHGFVFGDTGLWETTDGGEQWTRDFVPAGSILSLAIVRQQVLAINALCTPGSGCTYGTLIRRPLSGGSWTGVAAAPDHRAHPGRELRVTERGPHRGLRAVGRGRGSSRPCLLSP